MLGAWQAFPTLAVIAGIGILVGVAYTLRALQLAFFAEQDHDVEPVPAHANGHGRIEPITTPERLGAILLIGASLVIGLCPRLLLDFIGPSFNSSLFDGLRQIGAFPP